jgi:hypothetical protein
MKMTKGRSDGYTSTAMARDFWIDNFKTGEPFHGQMIHWDFAHPVKATPKVKRSKA